MQFRSPKRTRRSRPQRRPNRYLKERQKRERGKSEANDRVWVEAAAKLPVGNRPNLAIERALALARNRTIIQVPPSSLGPEQTARKTSEGLHSLCEDGIVILGCGDPERGV